MIEIILILIFLIILILSLVVFKLIKYYFRLCKAVDPNEAVALKIVKIFKNSLIFFIFLNLIFLFLFLIF